MRIRHRFLVFLGLVSVGPLALVSRFFLEDIGGKLNERINTSLDSGAYAFEMTCQSKLSHLETRTRQAVALSLGPLFRKEVVSEQFKHFNSSLDSVRRVQNFDSLQFYNIQGSLLLESGHIQSDLVQPIVKIALQGRTVASIATAYSPKTHGYELVYISAVPISGVNKSHARPLGVILSSESLLNSSELERMSTNFPDLAFRIFAKTPSDNQLFYHTNPELINQTVQPLLDEQKGAKYFKEKYRDTEFRSTLFPIQDFMGNSVGYMVVSTSNLSESKAQYSLYVSLYLFCVGLFVIFTAYSFNRTVIRPVESLAKASEEVAQGHLNIRLADTDQDVEMQQMIRNFNEMLARLEEDSLLKSTFVSTLTHDLRTPLLVQKRVLEALNKQLPTQDNPLNPMLNTLSQSNEQLLDMVNKLLEAYQYEAGRITIFPEVLNLHTLVEACCQGLHPLAESKNIALLNQIPPHLTIEADAQQLSRVFQNLLGNAISNIQAGKQVQVLATEQKDWIIIQVKDNGPGISSEVLPYLFQRYFSGHIKQKLGSGLGLFICRMIIELHGGHISVTSELNQGTDFKIEFPKVYQPIGKSYE